MARSRVEFKSKKLFHKYTTGETGERDIEDLATGEHYLYIVAAGDGWDSPVTGVKVGITKSPKSRIRTHYNTRKYSNSAFGAVWISNGPVGDARNIEKILKQLDGQPGEYVDVRLKEAAVIADLFIEDKVPKWLDEAQLINGRPCACYGTLYFPRFC